MFKRKDVLNIPIEALMPGLAQRLSNLARALDFRPPKFKIPLAEFDAEIANNELLAVKIERTSALPDQLKNTIAAVLRSLNEVLAQAKPLLEFGLISPDEYAARILERAKPAMSQSQGQRTSEGD